MKCPKCGNEQPGAVECAACGLIFEKYRRHLELRSQASPPPAAASPPSRGGLLLAVGGVFAAGALLVGFFFFGRAGVPAPVPTDQPQAAPRRAEAAEAPRPEAAPYASGPDILAELNAKVAPGNPIERARNGTVFIKTPWGVGSGFFIDDRCSIVTNRHVVKLSEADLAAAEAELQQRKNEARRLQAIIQANRGSYEAFIAANPSAASDDPRLRAVAEKIAYDEQKMREFNQKIRESEEELNSVRWNGDLKIVLADGTELNGVIDQVSDEHDLALLGLLGGGRCPAIPVGDAGALLQGDRLYTVGSPMGIRHSVTSGVYSGSIELDGKEMLQTDAPINPGNSGGPLIDQSGRVVGINTLVLNKAQGIGFAIPIGQAMQSLRLSRD